ncbi:MAG: hypothetical protein GC162_05365 [Planctomycetes bacterium]|nr:hypothetical protein [Planctomycetota bacterium]
MFRHAFLSASLVMAFGIFAVAASSRPDAEPAPAADREAIKAMAGTFEITFDFRETLALAPGYEFHPPYQEKALEWVKVIVDEPRRIALQHLLVTEDGEVIKHWRQEWTYEPAMIHDFVGNDTWEARQLSPTEARGMWSQQVTSVDDSPRYQSIGKWTHAEGVSCWESQRTGRPLPRREYTKRHDYQVLVAINRQTITPTGWALEEDNAKLVLDASGKPDHLLVREAGINTYRRVDESRGEPARQWWAAQGRFWTDVQAVWSELDAHPRSITLKDKVDNRSLAAALRALNVEADRAGDKYESDDFRTKIREVIARYQSTAS